MPLQISCDARLSHDVRDRMLKSQAKAMDLCIYALSYFSLSSYCAEGRSEEQNAPRQVPNRLPD